MDTNFKAQSPIIENFKKNFDVKPILNYCTHSSNANIQNQLSLQDINTFSNPTSFNTKIFTLHNSNSKEKCSRPIIDDLFRQQVFFYY